jgi:membrane-bound serine protease (ClpP class)
MVWLVVLLAVAGVGLIVSEIFLPGGVVGTLGVIALIGSLVLAWKHLSSTGFIVTLLIIPVAGAVAWTLALRVLPKTRLGRGVFLGTTQKGMNVLSGSAQEYTSLIGKRGTAHSYLRPAGVAEIEGRRVDVVTEGEFVAAGTPVEVLRLEGSHLVVRALDEGKDKD